MWKTEGIKSRWFNSFPEGQAWLKREEENRLEGENIGRRATKFGFERHMLITNRCRLGKGICQVLLRMKKGLIALVNFDDNLCMFRCLAVDREANKQ